MKSYKHKLLFDYFGQINEKEVDDFFTFFVRYHNKNSHRDLVKESERVIVPLGVTEIHLVYRNGEDRLIYKWNGKLVDMTNDIGGFLKMQSNVISLKMLFHAILDNSDGMTTSIRLVDVGENYDNIVF